MSLLSLIRVPLGWVIHSPRLYQGQYDSNPDLIKSREEHIYDMKNEEYDVLIIGAGSTGSGLALECATRGLKAAIVDANDFASGTSCKSTKLIHGGIRYLEAAFKKFDPAQLKLVFEGLRERSHMRIAGGNMLTKPVGMFIPQRSFIDACVSAFGVKTYQLLAKVATPHGKVLIPDSKLMSSKMASHLVYCAKRWKRSLLFFDGAHIDQRSVMHLINTATQPGYVPDMVPASAANYCAVVGMKRDNDGNILSAQVHDKLSDEIFDIKGKLYINCTGPFSDDVRHAGGRTDSYIQSSSGVHLMFPKRILNEHGGNTGVLIPKTSRGSVCFILPYQDYVVAGTTDTREHAVHSPTVDEQEVKYLCNEVSDSIGIDPEELERSVLSCWKGFRPLVLPPSKGGDGGNVSKVVRSHLVVRESGNFYSLMGGKWTSYREMGQDCLDQILDTRKGLFGLKKKSHIAYDGEFATELKKKALPTRSYGLRWSAASQTEKLRNAHFSGLDGNEEIGGFAGLLSRQFDIEQSTAQRLMRCYGYFAWDLLFKGRVNMTNKPLHIPFESRIIESEVEWLCDKEQARNVDDVVSRRLGLSFLDVSAATACIPEVACIMKRKLNWTASETSENVQQCAREIQKMAYHPIRALDALAE